MEFLSDEEGKPRFAFDESQSPLMGGMSTVLKGTDIRDGGKVAIKFLDNIRVDEKVRSLAFDRETRALTKLSHVNIIRMLDAGKHPADGRRYLVLEWLERNLPEYLDVAPLQGWDDFYERVANPVLSALRFAFSNDVLHRDLKPKNILVTADGQLKLSDFGIAKFASDFAPGKTLRAFTSEPFTPPPEIESRAPPAGRDVYAFAVTTLACLAPRPLGTRDDVAQVLQADEANLPPEIHTIIESALSANPADWPANVEDLARSLERAQQQRSREWRSATCYVAILPSTVDRAARLLSTSRDAVPIRILDELNNGCAFSILDTGAPHASAARALELICGQMRFRAKVDPERGDRLLISDCQVASPSLNERDRANAWQNINLRFLLGRPADSATAETALNRLLFEISSHAIALAEKKSLERDEQLFRDWAALLRAQQRLAQGSLPPISYSGLDVEGRRLRLYTPAPPPETYLDVGVTICAGGGVHAAGTVDAIGTDHLLVYSTAPLSSLPPSRGTIEIDSRASQAAINKQQQALDAVRYGRAAKDNLRDILNYPERALTSPPATVDNWRLELDEDKQRAVSQALTAPDILLVEGPPGTGKTRFIVETILQEVHRKPNSRILLCAQTHVALDNALERIAEHLETTVIIRAGNSDDPRAAPSVRSLLVESQAKRWASTVKKHSAEFLSQWATKRGIRREEVKLGIAIERVISLRGEMGRLQYAQKTVDAELERLADERERIRSEGITNRGDTSAVLSELARTAEDERKELRGRQKEVSRELAEAEAALVQSHELGGQLATQVAEELRGWQDQLIPASSGARRFRELTALVEEWELRLARASDFQQALVDEAQIIAATCVGFGSLRGWQELDFDLCVIDEASKALPTELLMPMSRSKRTILVGDPKQLPPFLDGAFLDHDFLADNDLDRRVVETTLFDRLLEGVRPGNVCRLTTQHRMVKGIGELISQAFYGGRLTSTRDNIVVAPGLLTRPVLVLSTSGLAGRHESADGTSYKNSCEVREILKFLTGLDKFLGLARRSDRLSAICLAGYLSQVRELDLAIASAALTRVSASASSVDAFQGREADLAIYSVTRSNREGKLGFLANPARLNVALSRGRDALIMVGDVDFLSRSRVDDSFANVLRFVRDNKDHGILRDLS